MTMYGGDKSKGLYKKFAVDVANWISQGINGVVVSRSDGSSDAGKKHDGCEYFVLDLNHDPYAAPALRAYAAACVKSHPVLSRDLMILAAASGVEVAKNRLFAAAKKST